MGQKKDNQERQKREAKKSLLQRYWKIAATLLGIGGFIGINNYKILPKETPTSQQETSEEDRNLAEEQARYGNLFPYKDTIPQLMVGKKMNGKDYLFEDFLPNLTQENNKFLVHVYIGEPPVRNGKQIKLEPVPGDLIEKVKSGLEKWNEYFTFTYVSDSKKADLNIYYESNVLEQAGLCARAVCPDGWNAAGWKNFSSDARIVGMAILLNGPATQKERVNQNRTLSNDVGHEFGHQLGLQHPEIEFYYKIILDKNTVDKKEVSKYISKIEKDYPEFKKLTIMTLDASPYAVDQKLGEFDKKAIEITFKLLKQKYAQKTESRAWQIKTVKSTATSDVANTPKR